MYLVETHSHGGIEGETHRDEDGLHGARAQTSQEALGLAQPVLVAALGVREEAGEELEGTEADGGLSGGVGVGWRRLSWIGWDRGTGDDEINRTCM